MKCLEANKIYLPKCSNLISPLSNKVIQIGYISSTTNGLETALPLIKNIIEPDLNAYAAKLSYNVIFEFIIDDAQGQAAIHLEKVQGFKSMGINLFIGGGWSSHASATLAYCNDNNMLMFSATSASPLLAIPDDSLYRMCPDDTIQAHAICRMLESMEKKYVLVIYRSDAWANGIVNFFEPDFISRGGVILEKIGYTGETIEFASYLKTADDIMAQAVSRYGNEKCAVIILSFDEFVPMIIQAQDYPTIFNLTWFGSDATALSQQAIEQAPKQATHLKIFSTLAAPTESEKFTQLYDRYYALTSQPFGYYSACVYDIAWILAQGILEAQSTDAKDIIPLLHTLAENHFGASGWTRLNAAGDRQNSNYQIWGYADIGKGIQNVVFGLYDSITDTIHWNEEIRSNNYSKSDVHIAYIEKRDASKTGLIISLTDNLRYIDINFERLFGISFFKFHPDNLRAIADLHKSCMEESDFTLRVAQLATLLDQVNKKQLSKVIKGKHDIEDKGSIFILQIILKDKCQNIPDKPFDDLGKIRVLRNIYPIHDTTSAKIKYLYDLGIDSYPFDWEKGWQIILNKTVNALMEIVHILNQL